MYLSLASHQIASKSENINNDSSFIIGKAISVMIECRAMRIRPYTAPDSPVLANIWLEASLAAHSFIPADYWKNNRIRMEQEYLPNSDNFVLEDDSGKVQGFISLLGRHVAALFVHPKAQGMGYGSALLRHAQQLHTELTLHVYKLNTDSVHFYEYHGFLTTAQGVDTSTGAEELRMRWTKAQHA